MEALSGGNGFDAFKICPERLVFAHFACGHCCASQPACLKEMVDYGPEDELEAEMIESWQNVSAGGCRRERREAPLSLSLFSSLCRWGLCPLRTMTNGLLLLLLACVGIPRVKVECGDDEFTSCKHRSGAPPTKAPT